MKSQGMWEVKQEFVKNLNSQTKITSGPDFGDLDHAASLTIANKDATFQVQKILIACFVLSNIIATGYVEKVRLIIDTFYRLA